MTNLWKSVAIFLCVKVFKKSRQDHLSEEEKRIWPGGFYTTSPKKRSDHKSKSIRGDNGGNDTLDLNSFDDDAGRAYSLSGEINYNEGCLNNCKSDLVYFFGFRSLLHFQKSSLEYGKSSNVSGFFNFQNFYWFSLCSSVALEISLYMKSKHHLFFLYWRPFFFSRFVWYLLCGHISTTYSSSGGEVN